MKKKKAVVISEQHKKEIYSLCVKPLLLTNISNPN